MNSLSLPIIFVLLPVAIFSGCSREPTRTKTTTKPNVANVAGFSDVAREAGIDFQMGFLPNEQGETFKINLYDHGCGVAIGDYDGDGHDDIYFLNQLGSNKLYRNLGDGKLEDVTAKMGVGLADRISVGAF